MRPTWMCWLLVGDDQQEYLLDDHMPAFCVYWGDR